MLISDDEGRAGSIDGAEHAMRVQGVHHATDDDRADRAADLQHRRDQRGIGSATARCSLDQRRHPVRQQIDHEQAHEEREPQQQRAAS